METIPKKLTKRDFESDQEPRWCPGCGDYSILTQMKKILPELGIPKENIVFVSGIGCSSRFPYYVDTYGFHGIHGRAPVIATGIKMVNPDLKIFIITGDGDGLSIGANHFLHLCRRNIDVTMILFNNQIYGLTKGQFSPTSEKGKVTKSSPFGSIANPFNPVQLALAAGATFVARSIDREFNHLKDILLRAANHRGTAFVEVYQNCNIFNDGAFGHLTDADKRSDHLLIMEEGKPYLFGHNPAKALQWRTDHFETIGMDGDNPADDLLLHDPRRSNSALEFMLAQMTYDPDLPTPIGVFREVTTDTYEELLYRQIEEVKNRKGQGDLEALLNSGNTWIIDTEEE